MGRIVYCDCACWAALPADTKQAVRAGLTGFEVEAVADLCELAARKDPALKRWAETPGLQIIACHPRAIRWLFAYAGAPLPADAVIHNMRLQGAEAILAGLRSAPHEYFAPREHTGGLSPPGKEPIPPRKPGEWVPWFPVIDYDRCQGCRQCFEFCLFGVYTVEGATVRVAQPDHCKTGCPACARVCPHSAIVFPKFKDGPISGGEGELTDVGRDGLKADLAGLSQGEIMSLLRRRSAARVRAAAGDEKSKEPPVP
jgi:Pyruvate/2-oxoacid:ferredoxin oxidoreductase delta subunit